MTPAELAVARAFRSRCREDLQKLHAAGPDLIVSVYAHYERHDCAARGGRAFFLELKEHYAFSAAYVVSDGDVRSAEPVMDAGRVSVPAKRFGWVWTQGRCPACGMTAASRTGRLVDPVTRPPAEHAIMS